MKNKLFVGAFCAALTGLAHSAIIPSGIQANVTNAQIAGFGWTECSRSSATSSYSASSLSTACTGDYLAMGIWDASLGVYGVVGIGDLNVVMSITYANYQGDDNGTVQNWSNGLNWYRTSGNGSWGFSTSGQTALYSADINLQNGFNSYDPYGTIETELAAGLSYHVGSDGNFSNGWAYNTDGNHFTGISSGDQRVFWTANKVPEPASMALLGMGLLAVVATRRKKSKT